MEKCKRILSVTDQRLRADILKSDLIWLYVLLKVRSASQSLRYHASLRVKLTKKTKQKNSSVNNGKENWDLSFIHMWINYSVLASSSSSSLCHPKFQTSKWFSLNHRKTKHTIGSKDQHSASMQSGRQRWSYRNSQKGILVRRVSQANQHAL